jgi:phosphorylcholine metabolism protein LicD/2-polyprenyl-3-methyl-5-hydroxy-6-metoxy-1,4-benzoquinol methylase
MSLKLASHLTIEQINNLKLGQNKMTNMLAVFDKICRKYNLSYWPMGGTLIGVARHAGWIPWDGDLDVGMLEEDYIKFKEIAENELPTTMWLQDPDPIINDVPGLKKIRDLYSAYTDHANQKNHQGLQIDIFIHHIESKENKKLIIADYYAHPWKGYSEFDYDIIFPLKRTTFEDIEIYSPNKIDKFCIQCYDNYPPDLLPIDQRYPHEGNIDPINPLPYYWDIYKDLYEKKTNKWFKNVAINAKDDEPLHHASGWKYLSENQWNDLCKHSLHGLNINNIKRLFDAGCGVGAFLKYINKINPIIKLYGNDICKEAIDKCKKEIDTAKVEVGNICAMKDIQKLENKFNFLICMGVISYLESLEAVKVAVNNFINIVKPGSLISICTLTENKNSLKSFRLLIPKKWWYEQGFNVSKIEIEDIPIENIIDRYSVFMYKNINLR